MLGRAKGKNAQPSKQAQIGTGDNLERPTAPLQSFLATRFSPSRRDDEFINRACIEHLTERARKARLTVIKAPAGYGKTTAASGAYWEIKKAGGIGAWLNLTGFDGSLAEFGQYVLRALSGEVAGQKSKSTQLANGLFADENIKSFSLAICNAANSLAEPIYLFIDNFDAIIDTEAESLICQILLDAPATLHLVISARAAPSFGLGRLRMQGQLYEMGVDQLQFSVDEAARLLATISEEPMDERIIELAVQKTEGWPAGLQLVAVAQGYSKSVEELLHSFHGGVQEVGEFLTEDVLGKLEPSLSRFLLETSILQRFCVPLCNFVTGRDDGRAMIDELHRRSLFIFSLDSEGKWYRYQSLFADFLLERLEARHPELALSLHTKASEWCIEEGLLVQGTMHAIKAKQYDLAADIITEHGTEFVSRGLLDVLYQFTVQLPEDTLEKYPRVRIWAATCLIFRRKFDEALPALELVEHDLGVRSSGEDMKEPKGREMAGALMLTKLMAAQFMDDMPRLERYCLEVNAEEAEHDDAFLGGLYISLLHAQTAQYRLDQVERLGAQARRYFERANQPVPLVLLEGVLGSAYMQRGEFSAAGECFARAEALCADRLQNGSVIWSAIAGLKGSLLLERLDLDAARDCFEHDTPSLKGIGFAENLVASITGRARLASFDGDPEEADRLLRDGIEYSISQSIDRLHWHCVEERIRQYIQMKDIKGARRIAAYANLPERDVHLHPIGQLTTTHEAMAMAWARLEIAEGRPKAAMKLLKRWLIFVERQNCWKSQINLSILLARAHSAMGEERSALRTINKIMPLVAKSGMMFRLVEDSGPLRGLIHQANDIDGEVALSPESYAARLKQVIQNDTHRRSIEVGLVIPNLENEDNSHAESLSNREIEILEMVARSMLNKEIAERLGLTEGSVKWYLQQIYDKLGVRRRLAALDRARALGYL